jgi:hypothetical protein
MGLCPAGLDEWTPSTSRSALAVTADSRSCESRRAVDDHVVQLDGDGSRGVCCRRRDARTVGGTIFCTVGAGRRNRTLMAASSLSRGRRTPCSPDRRHCSGGCGGDRLPSNSHASLVTFRFACGRLSCEGATHEPDATTIPTCQSTTTRSTHDGVRRNRVIHGPPPSSSATARSNG